MPKAYSYLRFSTPEQAKGDSSRRQTEMAAAYAAKYGLELDESTTYRDLGVSAYQGKNRRGGLLKAFLDAVNMGFIEQGSYLLVESLDRLSRETIIEAQGLFLQIIGAGITLVTLMDGREYSRDSLAINPTEMFVSLLVMIRAHEESQTKARRLKEVWKKKRSEIGRHRFTATCPSWLCANDRGGFDIIEDRAAIVRRIFEETLQGVGRGMIVRRLNADGVPPFKGKYWHASFVQKLMDNESVIGTLTPHTSEYVDGRRKRRPLEGVPGYYPAIIDMDTYQRANSLRRTAHSVLRGRHATGETSNVLGGLARCPRCKGSMVRTNKSGGYRYYVCTTAKAGKECDYVSVPYPVVEQALIGGVDQIIADCPEPTPEGERIQARLSEIDAAMSALIDSSENLIEAIQRGGAGASALRAKLDEVSVHREQMAEEERELLRQRAGLSKTLVDHKLEALREALSAESLNRIRANAALRQLLKSVEIDHCVGYLNLEWQHGGITSLFYAFPAEPRQSPSKSAKDTAGCQAALSRKLLAVAA